MLTENVDSLFHSLENFTQNEGIIGKPVVQGDKTFLPVVSITVGYGSGNSKAQQGSSGMSSGMGAGAGSGGALGLGAKLCTDAVIVIDNQNVSMMPMNSNASTLMDKIPQILSSMNTKGQSQSQGQDQNQGQSQSSTQS
jgi:uncharacterized spore protein YtfJ